MENSYGLWSLVIINSLVFIIFAFSFTKPKTWKDWRSFGAFSAFIVALFTEMYGFPLTIYFFSGWLSAKFPAVDFFAHNSGHLFEDLFGWGGDPHFGPFHIASYILIIYGFTLLSKAWKVLYKTQSEHNLATTGPYARIRHPQYIGFILIMFGFFLQWPTILTLIMFPILIWMYTRLARSEEKEAQKEFGTLWDEYAKKTPVFIPGHLENNMQKTIIRSIFYGALASVILLGVYFAVLTLVSGWGFTQSQFVDYWYFIVSLAIGFGIQIALYQYIKNLVHGEQGLRKVVGVSGTTSTAAMISCCAHYLVNLVPILGVTGLVTFAAQYQVKLFWVGIFFNAVGILYMISRIIKLRKDHE